MTGDLEAFDSELRLLERNEFCYELLLTITGKTDRELRVIACSFRTKHNARAVLLVLHARADPNVTRGSRGPGSRRRASVSSSPPLLYSSGPQPVCASCRLSSS